MFGDSKNIRDNDQNPIKDKISSVVPYKRQDDFLDSYPKLNKLVTALYIVTDIIEKDEPIRLKLRTLGLEIISDINSVSRTEIYKKTKSVLSVLDIAVAINLISEMNFNILKKEFTDFTRTLEENKEANQVNHIWLEEFLKTKESLPEKTSKPIKTLENKTNLPTQGKDFHSLYIIKNQRREDIIKAIKTNGGNATITEVKQKASGELLNCGEKTLQRELVAMSKEGILTKTGEKRWSRYALI